MPEEKNKREHEVEEVKKEKTTKNKINEKKETNVVESWNPKTKLGREVKSNKIKDFDEVLKSKRKILEPEIVDSLINVEEDLLAIGQSKGKFGGGKRRAWRQTQKKTKEGNIPSFSTLAIVGDKKGHIGIGVGKAKETFPARDKALRKAKLKIMKITRGDGSFESIGGGNTSIPFKVEGKSGSVKVILYPAPPGTGLVAAKELKKILVLAGIKDIYSKTSGRKRTTLNLARACIDALKKTNKEER